MDKYDPTMSPKPHWWQCSFFVTNSNCSSGVHLFVLVVVIEPSMHVYLWDAKGSELSIWPLIQELRDKGIPLTAKLLDYQRFDGWTCGYLPKFVAAIVADGPSPPTPMSTPPPPPFHPPLGGVTA